jgi:hypothetical protein
LRAKKPRALLVLGESDNDQATIGTLVQALRSDAPALLKRRSPMVLMKGREAAKRKKSAEDIAAAVKRESIRHDVCGVIAHEDCDDYEPEHEPLASDIEARLEASCGLCCIAAVPAWETEAWLFLWPDAAREVVPGWNRPSRSGQDLGLIRDAKEEYRKALRPKKHGKKLRDYVESDAPKIAEAVRQLGIVSELDAKSASFERFRSKVCAAVW